MKKNKANNRWHILGNGNNKSKGLQKVMQNRSFKTTKNVQQVYGLKQSDNFNFGFTCLLYTFLPSIAFFYLFLQADNRTKPV